jgi:hypothetical protein
LFGPSALSAMVQILLDFRIGRRISDQSASRSTALRP